MNYIKLWSTLGIDVSTRDSDELSTETVGNIVN